MNMKRTLLASAIVGMFFSAGTMAAGLTDQYDPYVTADEISVIPPMRTTSEERLADFYDPYITPREILVKETCVNPAMELIADQYDPFVTLAELKTAELKSTC